MTAVLVVGTLISLQSYYIEVSSFDLDPISSGDLIPPVGLESLAKIFYKTRKLSKSRRAPRKTETILDP